MTGRRMDVLTLQEALDFLEVSRSTLDRWRKWKGLPFIKIGKDIFFHKDDLLYWLRSQTQINGLQDNTLITNQTHTITVGYQSGTAHMWSPLIIKELRLFEEELDVLQPAGAYQIKWQDASNGLELVEGMIAGHVQIASLGDYPIAISQQLGKVLPGFNPVLLAFDGKTLMGQGISLVIPKEVQFKDLSELGEISTVINSSAGHRLNKLLKQHSRNNIHIINLEMNDSFTGIVHRRIGASAMWEPYLSLAKYNRSANVVYEEGLGEDYLTGVISLDEWAQLNEGAVIAYLRAHLKAHQFIRKYPLRSAKIIHRATHLPIEVVMGILNKVRWDAAVYKRDILTLSNLEHMHLDKDIIFKESTTRPSSLKFCGDYLEQATKQLKLPLIKSAPLEGEWSREHIH